MIFLSHSAVDVAFRIKNPFAAFGYIAVCLVTLAFLCLFSMGFGLVLGEKKIVPSTYVPVTEQLYRINPQK